MCMQPCAPCYMHSLQKNSQPYSDTHSHPFLSIKLPVQHLYIPSPVYFIFTLLWPQLQSFRITSINADVSIKLAAQKQQSTSRIQVFYDHCKLTAAHTYLLDFGDNKSNLVQLRIARQEALLCFRQASVTQKFPTYLRTKCSLTL